MSEEPIFRPDEILRRLVDAGVRFVLVGGLAAQAHGSTSLTNDLDICFARDADNLRALAAVLEDILAIRRGLPDDAPAMPPLDVRTLRASSLFTLSTRFGDFDLLANPDPGFDYESLVAAAIPATTAGTQVLAAGLDDLMAMKRAAGRPKDRVELEILGALREELDRRSLGLWSTADSRSTTSDDADRAEPHQRDAEDADRRADVGDEHQEQQRERNEDHSEA